MNIDSLTFGDINQLISLNNLNEQVGEKVIIRTYSAGVWFGLLHKKCRNEVILKDARRMWQWKCNKSISLSGVAIYGIDALNSKIAPPVSKVHLDSIEIISLEEVAIKSIEESPHVEAT